MYSTLKGIAKTIIPKQFLLRNERFIRSIFAFRYKGTDCKCTICKHGLKSFINYNNGELLCPYCGSRSRTRHLYNYLQKHQLIKGRILHFSPSRSLYSTLKNTQSIDYVSTDFEDEFIAEQQYNICDIPEANSSFDLIICYHILEHIPDDSRAIQELSRVLKPGGVCLVQTPFKAGNTYEDSTITSAQDRLKHFGQEDHVRIYSLADLQQRLSNNGFNKVTQEGVNEDSFLGILASNILVAKN